MSRSSVRNFSKRECEVNYEQRQQTQVVKDRGHPSTPEWKRPKIETLEQWDPSVGAVIEGELSGRDVGNWGAIGFCEVIRLRTQPCVDVPVRISSPQMAQEIQKFKPEHGTRLRIKRLKDAASDHFPFRFSVERVEVPDEGEAA